MSHEHVLLVEGINDLHAVRNLAYQHDITVYHRQDEEGPDSTSSAFEIRRVGGEESGGASKFARAIATHLKVDDLHTLGVVADADDDYAASWEARINELFLYEEDREFTALPDFDTRDGWIGESQNQIGDPVRVGTWIMPDNHAPGALEDFAAALIPTTEEDQALWEYAGGVIDGLPVQRFREIDRGKARMHTWLAWQDPPRELIGRSIKRESGGLDPQSELAVRFVRWIRRLFPSLDAGT